MSCIACVAAQAAEYIEKSCKGMVLYCCYIEGERGLINFYYFFLALILRLLGEFTVVMSVTVEFSAVMLVATEFVFMVSLR